MKKVLQFLCGRIFITAVLILLQLGWFALFLVKLTRYSVGLEALFTVLSLVMVLYLVRSDDNPAYKIGWIILIMAVPLLGGLLYLLLGNKRPSRLLRRKLGAAHSGMAGALRQNPAALSALQSASPRAAGSARYLSAQMGFPLCTDTGAVYYPLGDELYKALLCELEQAQHFIFMEYFIIQQPGTMWDSIRAILRRKAAQGVDVRLIYDDMGSLFLLPQNFQRQMEADGIRCVAFNPFVPVLSLMMNNRDHRKMTIIDGHTAFTGGVNLSDEYINVTHPHGHWKDTGLRLSGEAVWSFTVMFLEFWHALRTEDAGEDLEAFRPHRWHPEPFCGEGFVQPYADSPLDGEAVGESVHMDVLAQAQRYVYIFTPYLIIDDVMKTALCAAAKRGVDVRIVTPGVPDKKLVYRLTRSHYAPLLRAGVRIYEYTPGFIHAKSYVCDDSIGVVGTINMDYRSLYLHFECGVWMCAAPAVAQLRQDADATLAASREVLPADCHTGFWGTLLDSVLRLFAPLC